jgi:hypothetical protein
MNSLLLAAALAAAVVDPVVRQSTDPSAPPPPADPPADPGAPSPTGASPYARLLLLPDLSAVGSAGLAWSSYDVEARSPRDGLFGQPRRVEPYFQELELALQAVVDPYARADVFVGFHPDEVEVEEAYVTALRLPAGLLGRGGVFFTPFGRQNPQHPHVWEFVDQPLPLARLLAPEVLSGPGLDLAWLAPLPWFAELRVAYQGVRPGGHAHGDEEGEEEGASRAGTLRLQQVFDLGERTTTSVGVSGTLLEDAAGGFSDLSGVDVYVKRRLGATRASIALQAEAIARRLRVAGEERDTGWGAYGQVVLRPGPRTMYGVRYERAPGVVEEGAAGDAEHRVSALVGWLPSEFQRIRLQGDWDRLPGGEDGFEALLAIEFSFGAHGAHPF